MVGDRIVDRALVPMVRAEVEDEVELVLHLRQHRIVGNRPADERHPCILRHVLRHRREQVVHDHHVLRPVCEEAEHEVAADEASTARHEHRAPAHGRQGAHPTLMRRWVNVSAIPYSW